MDGWLVGDIKYSVKTLYNNYLIPGSHHYQGSQWQAISKYAKNYQYVPLTLFVTFMHGEQGKQMEELLMKDAAKKGVVMIISSIYGRTGKW